MATQVEGYFGRFNTGNGVNLAIGSTAYGYCQTAGATAAKIVDMTGFTLVTGATIFIKFQYANTAASPTLNVNGTGAKAIARYGSTAAGTTNATNGWPNGAVLALTYDGTRWIEHYWYNTTYNTTSVQVQGAGSGALQDKVGSATYWLNHKCYFQIMFREDNTYEGELTLSIASQTALPIYINEVISSSTNCTLPQGYYIAYCDENNFYINTDGTIPFMIKEAPNDGGYYVRKNKTWVDITSMLNI